MRGAQARAVERLSQEELRGAAALAEDGVQAVAMMPSRAAA
ncbi:MAG: hypothetical protein WCA22_15955 [Candidatus Binatus sp.]